MATGDQSDMLARMQALLPRGWFGDSNPILNALLTACANALAWGYTLYLYAQLQTRILWATDGWLDIIAYDFFGDLLKRSTGQSDSSFRNRIIINMFRERGTRKAISKVLYDLTGRYPAIVEPSRPADCGGYGAMGGYGVAGAYGSMLMPYQAFVTAYRPTSQGYPYLSGYSKPAGGYGAASYLAYASASQAIDVTDDDIIAALNSVKLEGTAIWMRISS
jgi:hypothetical protein